MPLFFLIPLLAGGAGFAGGFAVSEGLNKTIKVAAVAGIGYLAYTQFVKG